MEKPQTSSDTRNFLFICSVNRNRSKAAERVCNQLAQAMGKKIQCESAGVHLLAETRVTKQMADRADIIFVMEPYMKDILKREFNQPAEKIVCLDIPDVYPMQDPELAAIIRNKLLKYF